MQKLSKDIKIFEKPFQTSTHNESTTKNEIPATKKNSKNDVIIPDAEK